jgi:small subunit ribosomal protein S8
VGSKDQKDAEIQSQAGPPLRTVRTPEGVLQEIQPLPDVFQRSGPEWRNPRGEESQLVTVRQRTFEEENCMSMTDPISDYLTRVRNAIQAKHTKVDIPASKILKDLTVILLEEGYIQNWTEIQDSKQGVLRLYLKYSEDRKSVIRGLERVSKPGWRQYLGVNRIPRVLNGLGIAILTTSKGLLTDKKAKKENVGGEILCRIW